jgi:hypothetical protein
MYLLLLETGRVADASLRDVQVPAPPIKAHPVFLSEAARRAAGDNSGEPAASGAHRGHRAHRAAGTVSAADAAMLAAISHDLASSALPSTDSALPRQSLRGRSGGAERRAHMTDCGGPRLTVPAVFAADLASTPFAGADKPGTDGVRALAPSRSLPTVAEGSGPAFGPLDELLPAGVELTLERADSRLPLIRLRRRSQRRSTQPASATLRRQSTWTGGTDWTGAFRASSRWTADAQGLDTTASGERDDWATPLYSRSFVSRVVPGSLAMHKLRACKLRSLQESEVDALGTFSLRTKSQPTLTSEALPVDRAQVLHRSSSVHSIPSRPESRSTSTIDEGRGPLSAACCLSACQS